MANNHVIGSGLTERELGVASFWVRHRLTLRRLGYGSLIALDALLWIFILWSLLDAYVISYPREQRITANIAQNAVTAASLEVATPRPVQPSTVQVFDSTANRQDFLVELVNPNAQWWADFTYQFETAGGLTPERKGFLLPNEPQYLTEIGWKGTVRVSSATLRVTGVTWHRIDPSQVERDYAAFREKRLQIAFENVAYKSDLQIDGKTIGQTTFTLKNNSAFGYWAADLTIVLYRATTPIAVTRLTVRELKPGESRPMTVNWFENLSGISKTDIRASVNILNPNVYLPTNRF